MSATPDRGDYSYNCGILTWQIDQLNPGQTVECIITVQMIGLGDAVNIAEMEFSQEDAIEGEKRVTVVTRTFAKLTTGIIEKKHGLPYSLIVTINNTREFAQRVEILVVNLEKCQNDRCIQKIVPQNNTSTIELSDLPNQCEVIFDAVQEGVCIDVSIAAEREDACDHGSENDIPLHFLC